MDKGKGKEEEHSEESLPERRLDKGKGKETAEQKEESFPEGTQASDKEFETQLTTGTAR